MTAAIVLPGGVPLVEVERSGVVESVHRGHVVVVGPDGRLLESLGDPAAPIFPRSSNKPLQAVGMLRAGLTLPPADVALATASHSGEALHVRAVQRLLAAAGLSAGDLACPADLPSGEAARAAALAAGQPPARVFMNCSGKHTAMLVTCVRRDWPLRGYTEPDHPLQVAIRETVEDLAGEPVAAVGVDGCGAPVLALSLLGLARAFARIATAPDGPPQAVASAMRGYPQLVGGTGRTVTRLLSGVPGCVVKDGAEGVYAAGMVGGGAVAVKVDDGGMRAADRVVVAALRRLGVSAPVLTELAEAPVLGGGRVVGRVRMRPGAL